MSIVHGDRGGVSRNAIGCLFYVVVIAVLALSIEQQLGERMAAPVRPWAAVAAGVLFTLALGAAWSFVVSLRGDGSSRGAVLARARRGEIPSGDGIVIATGTVRPLGGELRAPLSDTPCVAYFYRMWADVPDVDGHGRRREVPHYWGHACRPFTVQTPSRAIRVNAVPRLLDPPQPCARAEHLERARAWIRQTRFQQASGLPGAVGSAIAMAGTLLADDDGEARGDWSSGDAAADPATLLREEIVVPVGTTVAIAGPWSAERHAIVPAADAPYATGGVMLVSGSVDTLLQHGPALPPGRAYTLAFALVLATLGGVILYAAISRAWW